MSFDDVMPAVQKKMDSVIEDKWQQMAQAWKSAIIGQMTDALMAGLPEVAYALPDVDVFITRKSNTEATISARSAGFDRPSISDDLRFYVLGPAKAYAFGGE